MKSLNLYVEDRTWIYFDTIVFLNIFCQTHFVLVFDIHEFLLCLWIVYIDFQLGKLWQIGDPFVSDMVCDPGCQQWITVKQETSLCDTIGLVVELLWHHLIEVFQFLILQNLCMKLCYTVYRVTCCDCKVCHLHLSVEDDSHLTDFFEITRIFCFDLCYKTAVDLFNNLIYTRKQSGEQFDWPFFQCFCHDSMVGVCACLGSHFPCLIPCQAFFIQKDTHQFGNCYSWMGIIQLEGCFFIELTDIIMVLLIFCNGCLYTCRNEEILLFQTQFFSCIVVIIWIQNFYDVAGQVFLFYCLAVVTLVKRIQLEFADCFCIPDT